MILVDKDIKNRASEIFQEEYDESSVTSVSYDLHVKGIIIDEEMVNSYILKPNEVVFIKTKEKIKMPNDLLGRIGEKNSRMRQGLIVAGPHYYPGHTTYLFLRVHNVSPDSITIEEDDTIAQIFFEKLSREPEKNYKDQPDASFNDEDEYRGLGKYEDEYKGKILCDVSSRPIYVKSSTRKWYDYDRYGRKVHYKDSDGNEEWWDYDSNGNQIYHKNSKGDTEWQEYDDQRNVIHYKNSDGFEQWWEYDEYKRQTHYTDSEGIETWYKYDDEKGIYFFKNNYGLNKWFAYDKNGKPLDGIELLMK